MNLYSILSVIAFTIYIEMALFVLLRNSRSQINIVFAAGAIMLGIFSIYHALIYSAPDKETARLIFRIFCFTNAFPICLQVHFIFLLSHNTERIKKYPLAVSLLYLPAIFFTIKEYAGYSLTKDFVLLNGTWFELIKPVNGWDISYIVYYYLYIAASFGMLINLRHKTRMLREVLMTDFIITGLIISIVIHSLINYIQPFILDRQVIPRITHISFLFYIFSILIAIQRYGLMGDSPAELSNNSLFKILSAREKSIIPFIYDGLTYREIAYRLFISEKTLKKHIENIFKKTGLRNKTRLLNALYHKKPGHDPI